MRTKTERFIDFSFTAKHEKIPVIKKYCTEYGIDEPILFINIKEGALTLFTKVLDDNDILE